MGQAAGKAYTRENDLQVRVGDVQVEVYVHCGLRPGDDSDCEAKGGDFSGAITVSLPPRHEHTASELLELLRLPRESVLFMLRNGKLVHDMEVEGVADSDRIDIFPTFRYAGRGVVE